MSEDEFRAKYGATKPKDKSSGHEYTGVENKMSNKALPYISDEEAQRRGIKIIKKNIFGRSSKKLNRAERNRIYNEGVANYERDYKKIFSCPVCGQPAPSKTALQTHIVNAHPDYYGKHQSRYEGFFKTRREKKAAEDEKRYKEDIKQYKY